MQGRSRRTATFSMDTKEKSIIEAQKYEIDKKQIYDFYGKKPKTERKYNVIKKQIAFGRDIAFKKIDPNKKYSNYSVFRELLQKEIDIEDIKAEIEQAKLLVNLSENNRDEFYQYFHFDRVDYLIQGESPTQIGIGMKGDALYTKNSDDSRKKQMTDIVLTVNDFIRKCKMLRKKREEDDNNEKAKTFKIFSDLNIPSNKFEAMDSSLGNKNRLNNKYFLMKQSLIRCFNREERFIHYNHLIKESYIKEAPDSLNIKTKDKYSSKYFDLMFSQREEAHYKKIDNFFSQYDITSLKLKDEEAEFYGKIYGILCKNNYMKFLSYLYSKNDIFKFIYDEFADKDAAISNLSLESSLASQIQYKIDGKNQNTLTGSESFSDNKIKQKELGITSESNKKDTPSELSEDDKDKSIDNAAKKLELLQQISNSYVYIKIGFLNKNIKKRYIKDFFTEDDDDDDDLYEEKEDSNKDKQFIKYLIDCIKEPIDDVLLINSGKILKIMDSKLNTFLEQKMSKVLIVKINRDKIKSIINENIQNQESFQNEYYICQAKKEQKKEFYLFKLGVKNINLFDNRLKDNFNTKDFKDFIDTLQKEKDKDKEKEKKAKKKESLKKPKKAKEDSDKEKSEESSKNKEKNIINVSNERGSKKSEEPTKKEDSPIPSDFNPNPLDSSNEKNQASIMNDSSDENTPSKLEKIIKDSNIKKTSKYQSEHKNYEFVNGDEKLYFEIIKGELRCKSNNQKMIKFSLNEITPQKVEEDKEHSCYKLEIKKGKNTAFTILNQDKQNLENFYFDLIAAKKEFGY